MLDDRCDVLVVGAGLAGCTSAALLAREGLRVVLAEREGFPRFREGEWMPPSVRSVWARLGFEPSPSLRAVSSSSVRVACSRTGRTREWPLGSNVALSVPRAAFDRQLLEHAQRSGAQVRERCEVLEAWVERGVVVGARVRESSGLVRTIRSRVLIDASGRDALLATRLSQRSAYGTGRSLLQGHFVTNERGPGTCELVLFPHGWCWRVPLPGGVESVGLLFSARWAAARRSGESNEDFFHRTLEDAPRVQKALLDARRLGAIRSVPEPCARAAQLSGPGWLTVGSAAASAEPLFGYPQALAFYTATLAAKAVQASSSIEVPTFEPYAHTLEQVLDALAPMLEDVVTGASGELLLEGSRTPEQEGILRALVQAERGVPFSAIAP